MMKEQASGSESFSARWGFQIMLITKRDEGREMAGGVKA